MTKRSLLWDVESNGLLKTMNRIHCIVLRDVHTRETFRFRHNDEENTIPEAVKMLEEADEIIGHNILRFDIPAVRILFPDFNPQGRIYDTLVLLRVIHSDIKQKDFALYKRGRLPAMLIGSQSLDSWGFRVGLHKGDYAKTMKALGFDPWAAWNQKMEDYCVNDVDITEILWAACRREMPPDQCVDLEQDIHDLCGFMENNGYPFDLGGAHKLRDHLSSQFDSLVKDAKDRFGHWYGPEKKKIVKMRWDDPDGINQKKSYAKPDTEWGEDYSRAVWGEITFPKRSIKSKTLGDKTVGAPYCKMKRYDFNPASRPHIIDRFTTLYNWVPKDFTEKGNPSVDDEVLTKLAKTIPEAKPLSEILFHQKLLGQLANGKNSLIGAAEKDGDGKIHTYVNTGGTVSGRCSHIAPNIAQVPAVEMEDDGEGGKRIALGRAGNYAAEMRSLFVTTAPFVQCGVDLSGIEFRCLAELCVPYDDGELIEVILSGDIHQINMNSTGIASRSVIKRIIYGLLYGAGDWKLGATAEPYWDEDRQQRLGASIRANLMRGLPALKKAIDAIQAEASKGYIMGLDGRRLKVRNAYSALNLRLQSDAALIAKKWVCLSERYLLDLGISHGWDGDFVFLAFVHDELQGAILEAYKQDYARLVKQAAADAGLFFKFRCPIAAESKFGMNWKECH